MADTLKEKPLYKNLSAMKPFEKSLDLRKKDSLQKIVKKPNFLRGPQVNTLPPFAKNLPQRLPAKMPQVRNLPGKFPSKMPPIKNLPQKKSWQDEHFDKSGNVIPGSFDKERADFEKNVKRKPDGSYDLSGMKIKRSSNPLEL